jgi:uncharacterized membrane protein YozB (DUF420 family)
VALAIDPSARSDFSHPVCSHLLGGEPAAGAEGRTPLDLSFLPAVNASLNAVAAVLLVRGRKLARARRVDAHRRTMISAFAVSALFLVLYVAHKASRGFENTTLHVGGAAKIAYLAMLASHVLLAMTVPVFAILLIRHGLAGRIAQHRRLARIAWPIWIYVSITGVLIYWLLYQWNPSA